MTLAQLIEAQHVAHEEMMHAYRKGDTFKVEPLAARVIKLEDMIRSHVDYVSDGTDY